MDRRSAPSTSSCIPFGAAARGAAVLIAIALGGCVPTSEGRNPMQGLSYQREVVQLNHDVAFLPGSVSPAPPAIDRLEGFLVQSGATPNDGIRIATYGSLGFLRGSNVMAELRSRGLANVQVVESPMARDVVTVSVIREIDLPTACLNQSNMRDNPGGAMLPAMGCANAMNLTRMVANPDDLYGGQTPGPAEALTTGNAAQRQRDGTIQQPVGQGTN